MIRNFLFSVFVGLDLFLSGLSFGKPWQTISARLGEGRWQGKPLCRVVANIVDWFAIRLFKSDCHCARAAHHYELMCQLPHFNG